MGAGRGELDRGVQKERAIGGGKSTGKGPKAGSSLDKLGSHYVHRPHHDFPCNKTKHTKKTTFKMIFYDFVGI